MTNPLGELNGEALTLDIDCRLMLLIRGSNLSLDLGLLVYHERDDALGLSAMAGDKLADVRSGKKRI